MVTKDMRCMVIMHNPMNDKTNNGKTVCSMLYKIGLDNLAQIYITGGDREGGMYSAAYRLSEKDMLKKFLRQDNRKKEAEKFDYSEKQRDLNVGRPKKRIVDLLMRTGVFLQFRNILWRHKRWYSFKLENWVNKFRPDVIFVLPGYIEGVMDCALYFAKELGIPIVTFVTDDYFSNTLYTWDVLKKWLYIRLYRKYKALSEYASLHYVIGEKMAQKYDKIFKCDHIPVMNNVKIQKREINRDFDISKAKFLFTGNCGIGRDKELIKLATGINAMNRKFSMQAELDIYTPQPLDAKSIALFERQSCCHYKGSVFGEQLDEVMDKADILIHVESFSKKYKNLLETALSTKIPEYMNSGKEILVIGPKYSASIDYILKYSTGSVITEQQPLHLEDFLYNMLNDKEMQQEHIRNAQQQVTERHSKEKNAYLVYKNIANEVEKGKGYNDKKTWMG